MYYQTRIFVTNSLNYLPNADEIIILEKGIIVEKGNYLDLKKTDGAFSNFIKSFLESLESNKSKAILKQKLI